METYSFTNLLNSIHNAVKQACQLLSHKLRTVFLNEVSTIDRNQRADRFALISNAYEIRVVRLPHWVRVCHGQDLGGVQGALVCVWKVSFRVSVCESGLCQSTYMTAPQRSPNRVLRRSGTGLCCPSLRVSARRRLVVESRGFVVKGPPYWAPRGGTWPCTLLSFLSLRLR